MIRPVLAILALSLALSACDRVRVEPFDSQLSITDPDLDEVQLDPDLTLRFTTVSPLSGSSVAIDGVPVEQDETTGEFVYQMTLRPGLNALHVDVTDEAGNVTRDTLYALHLPIQTSGPVSLASANVRRFGAAAAALDNTRVLLTGGIGASSTALATATVISVFGTQISSTEVSLQEGRAGHTATQLPDGRVLLLGGVRTGGAPSSNDFVAPVEIVSPSGLGAQRLLTEVHRSGHTTRVLQRDGRIYVYALGGIVPAGSGVAVSRTVDIFEYLPGDLPTLTRLTPEGGASVAGVDGIANAVQIPTALQEAVLFGTTDDGDGFARTLEWRVPGSAYPFALITRGAAPLTTPRTDAAGVSLETQYPGDGLALVLGGRSPDGRVLRTLDVYAGRIDRAFRVPAQSDAALASSRFGHTATILGTGRIVIAGGRGDNNVPLASLELLQL